MVHGFEFRILGHVPVGPSARAPGFVVRFSKVDVVPHDVGTCVLPSDDLLIQKAFEMTGLGSSGVPAVWQMNVRMHVLRFGWLRDNIVGGN